MDEDLSRLSDHELLDRLTDAVTEAVSIGTELSISRRDSSAKEVRSLKTEILRRMSSPKAS